MLVSTKSRNEGIQNFRPAYVVLRVTNFSTFLQCFNLSTGNDHNINNVLIDSSVVIVFAPLARTDTGDSQKQISSCQFWLAVKKVNSFQKTMMNFTIIRIRIRVVCGQNIYYKYYLFFRVLYPNYSFNAKADSFMCQNDVASILL